jgi:pseudoazurin
LFTIAVSIRETTECIFCVLTRIFVRPHPRRFDPAQIFHAAGPLSIRHATGIGPEHQTWSEEESKMKMTGCTAGVAALLLAANAAGAAEFEVKMLNKGTAGLMVFEPALMQIQLGDSVRFVPVDKGHDARSIKGMLPEGATPFVGKMSQEITVVFDKPGVYGIQCAPHYGLGMVALIVAGEAANLAEAQTVKQPGKAKQRFAALFDQLNKALASE